MSPYARWVVPSFKDILIDSCDEYLDSSDRGNDKTRSALIARVTKDIADIADKERASVPNDLEKCVRTWFGNYASGNSKEPRPGKSKSDTRGHPISSKTWTAKSVCSHAFADRISDEQIRLSGGGEKDIGKYRAALSTIFEGLTEAEEKQCEDMAEEWNTKPLPDDMQRKLSKTIPTEVTDFLKFLNHRTGAVLIAFAAYTNEDGEQSYARYETDGLKFFESTKEYRKGPNNILDAWKAFNLKTAEEADSLEALEFDEDGYPCLPDNVMELRLHRRKAILRQYMAAARRFYKLSGRPPWNDIAENPSNHLSKRSRVDSDHKLEEPSHMKSEGVDAWLKHWLKLQKKSKRPLVLKGPADQSPELRQGSNNVSKRKTGKGKGKGKARYIESEDSDDEETEDKSDTGGVNEGNAELSVCAGQSNERAPDDGILTLPPSPLSASNNRKTRRAFLGSLSNDDNYKKLLLLLRAAKDGDLLEESPPAWVTWESDNHYLSADFYNTKSTSSLSKFTRWITNDPITADDDALASYPQVELVALGLGLAFRALWVAQFPDRYSDVPAHIINSIYPFSEYDQLSHSIDNLVSGYAETLQELEAAFPMKKRHPKASTSQGISGDVVGQHPIARIASPTKKRALTVSTSEETEPEKRRTRSEGQVQKRLPGLGGVPSSLQYLREEVGLSGAAWESLGVEWRALGALWVQAETALSRSGRTDLSFNEVREAPIPDEWKEWMNAKLMNIDAKRPAEPFGKVFTHYLKSLPSTTLKAGGTVGMQMWCRPGKTGVLGLLLCLYWQAEYAGVGNDWMANVKVVEHIFNAILAEPDWQRAKRSRAASAGMGPSKRKRN